MKAAFTEASAKVEPVHCGLFTSIDKRDSGEAICAERSPGIPPMQGDVRR